MEFEARNRTEGVEFALAPLRAVGFSTYGEQIGPVHANQTLTGVILGRR